MGKWRLKRGMPEWHEIMTYTETLPDGTVITAQTEDCDGDVEYWWVEENGVRVAEGEERCDGSAQLNAERVICCGATRSTLKDKG